MRIAIVKLSALGDIIHAMAMLQLIKKHHPQAKIDWIVEREFKDVLMCNPHINHIHAINLKQAKRRRSLKILFKELKKLRQLKPYDLIIDAQGLIKSAIISRIIPSKRTFGFNKKSLREPLAARFYSATCDIDYAANVIKRNLTVAARALNITTDQADTLTKQPFLYFNHPPSFGFLSTTQPNIAIIPGASFDSKIYPIAQYAELTRQLNANFIIIWGSQSERTMAQQLQRLAPEVHIANQLSIDALKSLISTMDLVLGGDTGPTHMAWALNIPSITLFGPTPGYRNTLTSNINRLLESQSSVNPYKINKKDDSIKDIRVSDIAQMAAALLGSKHEKLAMKKTSHAIKNHLFKQGVLDNAGTT